MLNKFAVESVHLLARKLADRNIQLSCVSGSPLQNLHMASDTSAFRVTGETGGVDFPVSVDDIVALKAVPAPIDGYGAIHDTAMELHIASGIQAVTGSLHAARNIVNPICLSVLEKVQSDVDRHVSNAAKGVLISPVSYAALWSNPGLLDLVGVYEEAALGRVEHFPEHTAEYSGAELVARMRTGSASFDRDVDAFVKQAGGEDQVAGIYNWAFKSQKPDTLIADWAREATLSNIDNILIVYLLARSFRENIPEGINSSLDDYKSDMLDLISYAGITVLNMIRRRDRQMRNNTLVIQYPWQGADNKEILVNADVYDKWLSAGGSPEVLMGAYYSDKETGYNSLLTKRDEYTTEWDKQARRLSAQATADKYTVLQSTMADQLFEVVRSLEDNHLVGNSRGPLFDSIKEHLARTSIKDLDDLPHCVRRIVCLAIFPQTNALQILQTMDKLKADMPEADMREISLLATIDVCTDWLSTQIAYETVTYAG